MLFEARRLDRLLRLLVLLKGSLMLVMLKLTEHLNQKQVGPVILHLCLLPYFLKLVDIFQGSRNNY